MSYLVLPQMIIFLSGATGCNVLIYNRLYAIPEMLCFSIFEAKKQGSKMRSLILYINQLLGFAP